MAALRNPKREAFAQNLAKSPKSGKSITQCYLDAGYQTSGESAHACASRLLSSATVKDRVDEILRPVVRKSRITVESLLSELEITIADARSAKQHGTVVSALTLAAKLVGLLQERVEISGPGAFAACEDVAEIASRFLEEFGAAEALSTLDELRDAILQAASEQARTV